MKNPWKSRRRTKRRKRNQTGTKTHYIYQLFNDTTRMTFYVGRTTNPHGRMARHRANQSDSAVAIYIRESLAQGHDLKLYVLDEIRTSEIETAKALESCWLQIVEATGVPLMNGIRASSGATINLRLVTHQLAMIHLYPNSDERKRVALQQTMKSMPWAA